MSELKQVDKSGKKRRASKAKKAAEEARPAAPGERGDWAIRVPPTPELLAVLAKKQADAVEEIRRHQRAIDDSAERHKLLKKEKEKAIQDVEERQDKLVTETRYGTTAKRRCYRRREGDEWAYLGLEPPHEELWREPAADGQQQRLMGKETAPRGSELDRMLRRARELEQPGSYPVEGLGPRPPWPWCELSWHPLARRIQQDAQEQLVGVPVTDPLVWHGDEHTAGLDWVAFVDHADPNSQVAYSCERLVSGEICAEGPGVVYLGKHEHFALALAACQRHRQKETDEVRQAEAKQVPKARQRLEQRKGQIALKWGKIPGELTWHTKGSRVHQYRVDLTHGTDVVITAGAPHKPSQHVELMRYKLPPEPDVTAEVKLAKRWCQEHRDSRLRWPGDPASGLLVSACNRYQCVRHADGDEIMAWHAEAVGGQDQNNTDLGEHDDPQAAQAACQAHVDELRRAGQ